MSVQTWVKAYYKQNIWYSVRSDHDDDIILASLASLVSFSDSKWIKFICEVVCFFKWKSTLDFVSSYQCICSSLHFSLVTSHFDVLFEINTLCTLTHVKWRNRQVSRLYLYNTKDRKLVGCYTIIKVYLMDLNKVLWKLRYLGSL